MTSRKSNGAAKGEAATLALADGTVFRGQSVGAPGETSGEVVFNTSMTGYQEILTDPSYAYQMLTFTYPHIGNVGVNREDVESSKVQVSGVIVRSLSERMSNFRGEKSLRDYLLENKVVGIAGLDTRALVLHIRTYGAQMGVLATGARNSDELVDRARALQTMEGLDLAKTVSTVQAYEWKQHSWRPGVGYVEVREDDFKSRPHVVAVDFGIKFNILRLLTDHGLRVTVVPNSTSSDEILNLHPDGVFLANGPGDPAAVKYGVRAVRELLGKKPIFGICLGHQILGHALGLSTFKLKFGHRGGNHPVRNEQTKKVEITVQNHGFAVSGEKVPDGVIISHLNLNDGTVEGLEAAGLDAFSVQYHPESSPGPHDAQYLFRRFAAAVKKEPPRRVSHA